MSDSIDDYLSSHERAFTAACGLILHSPVPADAAYGLFWIQFEGLTSERFPIAVVWCDLAHGCDVQHPSPITSIPSAVWSPPQGLDDSAMGERFFHWISRCWNNAGGGVSPVPFYCHNYHTAEQFCLRRGRYITDEEINADIEPAA